jgi:hypothetical protein
MFVRIHLHVLPFAYDYDSASRRGLEVNVVAVYTFTSTYCVRAYFKTSITKSRKVEIETQN